MRTGLHPELAAAHDAFLHWLDQTHCTGIKVRETTRSPQENEERNLDDFQFQISEWRKTHWLFSPNQANRAEELLRLGADELRREARRRFSWHAVGCAISYDTSEATTESASAAREWWSAKLQAPMWRLFVCHPAYLNRGISFFTVECHDYWRRKAAAKPQGVHLNG